MSFGWCGLLLLVVAAGAQTGDLRGAEQSRIRALESAWNQAVVQKDVKAIETLMGNELIYIDYDGTMMNKAEYLASLRAAGLHFEHIVSNSMQVQLLGQSAVVIGVYSEKGAKNGKPYLRRERFIDTWILQNGLWVCVASQSTLILH